MTTSGLLERGLDENGIERDQVVEQATNVSVSPSTLQTWHTSSLPRLFLGFKVSFRSDGDYIYPVSAKESPCGRKAITVMSDYLVHIVTGGLSKFIFKLNHVYCVCGCMALGVFWMSRGYRSDT